MKDDRISLSAYFVIVSTTIVIRALGSSVGGPVTAIIRAVCGLGWGLLVGVTSNWLRRRAPTLSRCWVFLGGLVAATLFGGSLFAMLLYSAASTPKPSLA